jgi:hypothetical protein
MISRLRVTGRKLAHPPSERIGHLSVRPSFVKIFASVSPYTDKSCRVTTAPLTVCTCFFPPRRMAGPVPRGRPENPVAAEVSVFGSRQDQGD